MHFDRFIIKNRYFIAEINVQITSFLSRFLSDLLPIPINPQYMTKSDSNWLANFEALKQWTLEHGHFLNRAKVEGRRLGS